jgi:tRNA(Ile)-lysidine synthase
MNLKWRDLIDEINSTSERYLLCVSGGVDSMFLMAFFAKNCTRPIRVAHFNHGLRPAAREEETFVRNAAERLGFPFLTAAGDPEAMRASRSLEAEARRQRYDFLETVRDDGEMLVTGHHANDQLETVLLRLMRGYPDDNLRMKRINGTRYRPLLEIPKEVILDQAKRRGVEWMDDDSNADNAMERNWVRNVLVPQMMERRNVLKTIGLKRSAEGDETSHAPSLRP